MNLRRSIVGLIGVIMMGSIVGCAVAGPNEADHVEGYVGVSTPYGQKRERFY
jgi:hypothetical protein